MPGDNRLVTENYLRLNFSPKAGITPGTNDLISLDCDQIKARYSVNIAGVTNTGLRCPSQNQISAITQGSIGEAFNITSGGASHNCVWEGNGYLLNEFGVVCSTSTNATTSNYYRKIVTGVNDNYTRETGMVNWNNALQANTTYYSRAYMITSQGTFYSNEVIFTTLP